MLTLSWAMGKTLGHPVDKDHLMSELDVSWAKEILAKRFPLNTDFSLLQVLVDNNLHSPYTGTLFYPTNRIALHSERFSRDGPTPGYSQ
jgi:hypothetical protein